MKPNNPDVKVEEGTLYIHNIQKGSEGYYLCEAVNGIGSGLSAVIMISVQGNLLNISFSLWNNFRKLYFSLNFSNTFD